MNRVVIVGSGGSGKSTLARRLGERTGLPVVHLDVLFWNAGWVETPDEVWVPDVERLAGAETWILDGNFGGTMEIRLARADTIVFLDFPRWRCIGRALRRTWRYRGRSRPDLAPGCPERLDAGFLLWLWRFPRRSRPQVVELIERHRPGRRIEILRSPRDVRRFLGAVSSRLR